VILFLFVPFEVYGKMSLEICYFWHQLTLSEITAMFFAYYPVIECQAERKNDFCVLRKKKFCGDLFSVQPKNKICVFT
jgi:hypothetical protein